MWSGRKEKREVNFVSLLPESTKPLKCIRVQFRVHRSIAAGDFKVRNLREESQKDAVCDSSRRFLALKSPQRCSCDLKLHSDAF